MATSLQTRQRAGVRLWGALVAVLVVLAHLAVRKFAAWADPLLLPLAATLNGLGIVMMGAAVSHASLKEPRPVAFNVILLAICAFVAAGRLAALY